MLLIKYGGLWPLGKDILLVIVSAGGIHDPLVTFYTPVLRKQTYYGMGLSVRQHSCMLHDSVTVQDIFMQFYRNMY